MINVKDKYSCIQMRDEFRSPWSLQCDCFKWLNEVCDVISTCAWKGGRDRVMKLTKMTASAFIITKKTNIDAAYHLLAEIKFSYVLQAIIADEVLEKFFLARHGRELGVTFTLILGILQLWLKLSIFIILSKMTYFPLEKMNLAI